MEFEAQTCSAGFLVELCLRMQLVISSAAMCVHRRGDGCEYRVARLENPSAELGVFLGGAS